MRSKSLKITLILVAIVLFASPAHANVGLPMIAVMWPLMMLALLPIIAIEAYVLSTKLAMTLGQAASVSAWANGISTIVGIPLTWVALSFVPVIQKAAWLVPFEEEYDMDPELVFPTSALVLLVPFFFASWLIEYRIAVWRLPGLDAGAASAAVFVGNAITYACLAVFILAAYIWVARREQRSGLVIPVVDVEALEDEDERGRILKPSHGSETTG